MSVFNQRGLSLIEMMVAMTIGLMVLVAVGSMMVSSNRNFKVQDNFARIQDNGAYAMNILGQSLRMSAYYGYSYTGELKNHDLAGTLDDSSNPCGINWIVNNTGDLAAGIQPISGYSELTAATVNATVACIEADNFLDNSPILILRSADGILTAPASLAADGLYIQSDIAKSIIFVGSDYGTAGFSGGGGYSDALEIETAPGVYSAAPISRYMATMYYLRPCSRPSNAGLCTANDDGGHPIPTLVRQIPGTVTAGVTSMAEEAIAEGIERMSVQYGIDTSVPTDGVPDQYVLAPAAAQWARVVSVRVTLLVRSPVRQVDYSDSAKSYDLGGGVTFTCGGDDCHYHRHVFSQTFQIRNLAQRSGANA